MEMVVEARDTLEAFKNWARDKHYDPLYKKKGLFFGSVFKNSLATYKDACGYVPERIIDTIHDSL